MRCAHGQSEVVRCRDCRHGYQLSACALRVGEVLFADLFTDGNDDALPADHRAEAQCQSDRDFDPPWNELRCLVELAFVVGKRGSLIGVEFRIVVLQLQVRDLGFESSEAGGSLAGLNYGQLRLVNRR